MESLPTEIRMVVFLLCVAVSLIVGVYGTSKLGRGRPYWVYLSTCGVISLCSLLGISFLLDMFG